MIARGKCWKNLEKSIKEKAKHGEKGRMLKIALAGYYAGRADILNMRRRSEEI